MITEQSSFAAESVPVDATIHATVDATMAGAEEGSGASHEMTFRCQCGICHRVVRAWA